MIYPIIYANKRGLKPQRKGLYFIEDTEGGWLEGLRDLKMVRWHFKNGTAKRCFGPISTPCNYRKLVKE